MRHGQPPMSPEDANRLGAVNLVLWDWPILDGEGQTPETVVV